MSVSPSAVVSSHTRSSITGGHRRRHAQAHGFANCHRTPGAGAPFRAVRHSNVSVDRKSAAVAAAGQGRVSLGSRIGCDKVALPQPTGPQITPYHSGWMTPNGTSVSPHESFQLASDCPDLGTRAKVERSRQLPLGRCGLPEVDLAEDGSHAIVPSLDPEFTFQAGV